jgi:UDP-N-acetylmuramyl pentapeptide phosphotransferase/UDP-N-acetylglucosamine-1-phosphate transferase
MLILFIFCIFTFFFTILIIPTVLSIGRKYRLYDNNSKVVPIYKRPIILGGICIVIGFAFSFKILSFYYLTKTLNFESLNVALLLIFIIGIADDLVTLTPLKKLFFQFLVATILIFAFNLQLPINLFFTETSFEPYLSILISYLSIIITINAFNLIDGVDGLSSCISIISLITFGILFFLIHDTFFACMSFSLAGAILAFYIFNKNPAKMYMGDTGALFIGAILSVFTIMYIKEKNDFNVNASRDNAFFCVALVWYPIIDLMRLFIVRILNNKSPLKGDKKHLHHLLIEFGLTPNQITFSLSILHILFISIFVIIQSHSIIFYISSFIIYYLFVQLIEWLTIYLRKNNSAVIQFNSNELYVLSKQD